MGCSQIVSDGAAEYRCVSCGQLLGPAVEPAERFAHPDPSCEFWAAGHRGWDGAWPQLTTYIRPPVRVGSADSGIVWAGAVAGDAAAVARAVLAVAGHRLRRRGR